MPQDITAVLDTILVHLSLAYCTHLLIKAVLFIHRRFLFRNLIHWRHTFISRQRVSSKDEWNISNHYIKSHFQTDTCFPVKRAGLQNPALPLQSKVYLECTSSELSASGTSASPSETSSQQLRLQTRPANEPWDDAACETDADLAKQAFRNMVRARRDCGRAYIQARLAERRRPSYSLFGLTWPFS